MSEGFLRPWVNFQTRYGIGVEFKTNADKEEMIELLAEGITRVQQEMYSDESDFWKLINEKLNGPENERSHMEIACPHCKNVIYAPEVDHMSYKVFKCPMCKKKFECYIHRAYFTEKMEKD